MVNSLVSFSSNSVVEESKEFNQGKEREPHESMTDIEQSRNCAVNKLYGGETHNINA
uniref:Uncharacterized protein n=1 Tax=Lotus japonicus TaxID=34305 RepID=I3SUE3_LOTJA|nr:unknown [Lotus japonicus]